MTLDRHSVTRGLTILAAVLALATLSACQPSVSDWLFERTGEEELLPQIRGMIQLAKNVLHPQPRTAYDAPIAHTDVNPFGINVFLNQEVEIAKRERSLQMIAEAGFHWVRQEFPWEDIEIHGKGDFEDRRHEPHRSAWEKYDNIVELTEQHDLELIVRLSNPPSWSRALTDTVGTFAPPDDLDDWGDFVEAVVSRYEGKVRYYQLWNEPNVYPEWGEQPVNPEEYTQLLCEGYRRAKAVDPDAVIISGALAPTVSLDPGPGPALGMNEFVFLQRMYAAGAADCFDILSVNDYMLWSGPTDHRMRPDNINFARPLYVRDIMVANGDANKPIWISEMNSNAVPNDPEIQGVGAYGQVTLEQQARYAPLAYQRAMEEWPWVGVVNYWFFKLPSEARKNQSMYYFRMVEPDFTPMPVYAAMEKYTEDLTPALYPGRHEEDHWALDYEDGWVCEHTGEGHCQASESGAVLRFAFEGAALTLLPGPGEGQIEVSIDGETSRRVSLAGEPVQLVSGALRQERHDVTLAAVTGDVGVDALVVTKPWRPSTRLVLSVIGASIALAWGLGCILRRR